MKDNRQARKYVGSLINLIDQVFTYCLPLEWSGCGKMTPTEPREVSKHRYNNEYTKNSEELHSEMVT